jgi:DNA-binding transcriptional MerR regulator
MSRFILKSKLNSLLRNNGKPSIVEVIFLGTGGAFDLAEKNSSVIIRTSIGTILIDCGSTVYPELQARKLVEEIDYIFITHCHEDHIGSLSTLVYHKYFGQKKTAKIECVPSLVPKIEDYLENVCGHEGPVRESFEINSNPGTVYEDLSMVIHKIDTTNHHYKDYPSGGFVFNLRKGGEDLFVVYSGDINVPITDIIEENHPKLYESLLKNRENVFIFHESTARVYAPHYPHCEYQKLERTAEIFPNIYTYHHSQEETKSVMKTMRESKMKLEAIKKAIDADLNKKLSLVKTHELQEKLRIQAKRLKDNFTEDLYMPPLKTKDLNTVGKELVIQEEMDAV